jgi:phytoene/squalene synthetase
MERAMPEPDTDERAPSPQLLRGMAATLGVTLSAERAAALATQAAPHFALLRALDDIADSTGEPAAEFRLDDWRGDRDA